MLSSEILSSGIVFVLPPSSLVGAFITSESISSRCRRITAGRRAETKTSPERTNQLKIYNLRFQIEYPMFIILAATQKFV